jgi:2-methylcitrate dehydratase PrpD
VAPEAIAAVTVRVPPAYAGMISTKAQDGVRTTTLVSVARQLALLAHDPARLYDVDRSAPVTDQAIRSFEAKVTILAEPSLAQYYPSQWPAEVEVIGTDGSTRHERVIAAPGDPSRPLDDGALDDKAHRLLDHLIGRARADELIGIAGRGLADAANCRALAGAFVQCFPIIA